MFIKVSGTSDWQREDEKKKKKKKSTFVHLTCIINVVNLKVSSTLFYVRLTVKLSSSDSNKIVKNDDGRKKIYLKFCCCCVPVVVFLEWNYSSRQNFWKNPPRFSNFVAFIGKNTNNNNYVDIYYEGKIKKWRYTIKFHIHIVEIFLLSFPTQ